MNENIKTKVVGIDIGVSETNIAVVDLRGAILARDTIKTTDYATVDAFITGLSEHVVSLAESTGGYDTVRSVGVCSPSANFQTAFSTTGTQATVLHHTAMSELTGRTCRTEVRMTVGKDATAHPAMT